MKTFSFSEDSLFLCHLMAFLYLVLHMRKLGPLGLIDILPLKALKRINEVRFIKCLGPLTLSIGYRFLEMEAKLSRKLMAWLKGQKKSIELKLFRKGSDRTWSSNYSFRFQTTCV